MGSGSTIAMRRRGATVLVVALVTVAACGGAGTPAGDELPELPSTTEPATEAPTVPPDDELDDPDDSTEPTDDVLPGEGDLPAVLAATAAHRVLVYNSFGGGSPFDLVQVIERLGTVDGMGFLDASDGRLLTDDERDAITTTLAPLSVEFVPADVLAQTDAIDDAPVGRAVVTLSAPSELEGKLVVTSQLWCGGTCGIGGANELVRSDDGSWSIGDPVGTQWIS